MMTEDKARELLPIYADGELNAAQARELESVLAGSEMLRDELERWRQLRRSAGRVFNTEAAPAGLKASIFAKIAEQEALPPKILKFRRARWLSGLTAVAAAVALMMFLFQPERASAIPTIAPDRFTEIFQACAKGHEHNTLGLDTKDLDRAREQLTQIVGPNALLPDLSASGFQLAGACRCFHADDLTAVHVFYKRSAPQGGAISLFTVSCKVCVKDCRCESCKCPMGCIRKYEVACANQTTVVKWDEGTCSYAVCSDLSAQELRQIADSLGIRVKPMPGNATKRPCQP